MITTQILHQMFFMTFLERKILSKSWSNQRLKGASVGADFFHIENLDHPEIGMGGTPFVGIE